MKSFEFLVVYQSLLNLYKIEDMTFKKIKLS
jgi:hypothetical protein